LGILMTMVHRSIKQSELRGRAMTAFGFLLLPVGGALILFGVAVPWVDGRLTLVGSLVFTAGVLILLVSVVIGFAKDRRRRR
jgi:Flp pilus assembly protein TadB